MAQESHAELRNQIEHTRAEMSQTIDAIHERLRPRRLAIDAKESMIELAKAHSILFALAGAAAAALIIRAVRRSRNGGDPTRRWLAGAALAGWRVWKTTRVWGEALPSRSPF